MAAHQHANPPGGSLPSFAELKHWLALRSFELREVEGAFVVSKWGLLRTLPDLQSVVRFCQSAGMRA